MSEPAVAIQMEEYAVSEACIACDACCNDFPDIFKMNGDHTMAIAFAPSEKGKINPWDAIYVCPVDAISLIKGELPPPPVGKKKASHKEEDKIDPSTLTDTRPWEIRWAEAKKTKVEGQWERMKRYGQAVEFEETLDKYLIRIALPEKVPEHQYKYKWNLPDKMPDYKLDVQLNSGGKTLKVKGWLEDTRVKKLCGVANSFPDRFLREFTLARATKELKQNYNPQEKVLDIILEKA